MSEMEIVHTDKEMASPDTPEKESVEEKVKEWRLKVMESRND